MQTDPEDAEHRLVALTCTPRLHQEPAEECAAVVTEIETKSLIALLGRSRHEPPDRTRSSTMSLKPRSKSEERMALKAIVAILSD